MAAKMFLVLVCLAISHAALVKREASTAQSILQDLGKHAAEFQKTFSEQFNSIIESKNTQEMQKVISDNSESLITQFTAFSTSLQEAVSDATGKAKEALQTAQANVQKTADDLRKAHPEVEAQAGQFRDKLQAAVQSTLQETQKLAKEVGANLDETNQKLTPNLKQAYDDLIKKAQELQKQLHETANKQ